MRRRPGVSEIVSGAVARLAALRVPGAAGVYARAFGADPSEAERPLDEYPSVLEFFTRRLKPSARPVDPDPRALVSPVDGVVLAVGPVGDGRLIQSKDRRYALSALLDDPALAERFTSGAYATVYLSPGDYHRIHAPADLRIERGRVIPGALLPVNRLGTRWVADLFPRNRRVVVEADAGPFGRVAVIMVGATNVGAVRASFDPDLTRAFDRPAERSYRPAIAVARGAELGIFELGSTVVVATERPLRFSDRKPGEKIRMGQVLGRRMPTSASP